MNKFKCTLIKQVHSCFGSMATGDIYLEVGIELPFAPYPKLNIFINELEDTILEVYYDYDNNIFKCYTEENKELYNAELHHHTEHRSLDEIVKYYLDIGWEKRK